jgi:hypothetical protein
MASSYHELGVVIERVLRGSALCRDLHGSLAELLARLAQPRQRSLQSPDQRAHLVHLAPHTNQA